MCVCSGKIIFTDWLVASLRRRRPRCRPPNGRGVRCTRTRRRLERPTTAPASAAALWPSACTLASCTIWFEFPKCFILIKPLIFIDFQDVVDVRLLVAVEMLEQFETAVTLKLVLAQDEFRPGSGFASNWNKLHTDASIKENLVVIQECWLNYERLNKKSNRISVICHFWIVF